MRGLLRPALSLKQPLHFSRPLSTRSGSQRLAPHFFATHSFGPQIRSRLAPPRYRIFAKSAVITISAVGFTALLISLVSTQPLRADSLASQPRKLDDVAKYSLKEVSQHDKDSNNPWVIFGTKVYDITEWVPSHPGGEVILRAAGSNIDPYWKIFTVHQQSYVHEILDQYCIGEVDPKDLVDGQVPVEEIDDPFVNDPHRDPRLRKHTERPCNAETPSSSLGDYITPNNVFYVRNHLWVPEVEEDGADNHKLTIQLVDGEEKTYTLKELRQQFEHYKITASLQCSGNRRSHMNKGCTQATSGLPWDVGAIGNAEWTGVRLRDVLQDAGAEVDDMPSEDIKHAQFVGSEAYGASIPIEKAVDRRGDVLLAWEMNGQPLPRDHGYPLRVIVPGHVAARSVKWISKVMLSDEESTSQWQRRDYKCFGPNVEKNPDWDSAPAIQEMPVQSAITKLEASDQSTTQEAGAKGSMAIEGYAFSGGGRKIIRVDVSADEGCTWQQAELVDGANKGSKMWSWQRWRLDVPREKVGQKIVVKAVDESYNTQPESFEANWNVRGNLTTGWHKVPYDRPE